MVRPTTHIPSTLVYLLLFLFASLTNCQCNTDQNPYCAGNNQFEQLCCTYPNICYWSNRNGDPACCQAGSDCRGDGGPAPSVVAFTAVQQTTVQTTYYVQTVYSTTTPQYSTVTYYSYYTPQATTTYVAAPPPVYTSFSTVVTPAVVVVTATQPVVAPVTTNGVFVTFSQVNAASRNEFCFDIGAITWYWLGLSVYAWVVFVIAFMIMAFGS